MTDERADARKVAPKLLGLDALTALVASRLGGGASISVGRRVAVVGLSTLPANVMRPLLMTRVSFSFDDAPAEIALSPKLIESLIGSVLPNARATELTETTRGLALEAALADALDDLEARLGATITLTGLSEIRQGGDGLPPNIGVRLAIDGASPILLPAHLPEAIVRKLLAFQAGTESAKAFDPEVPLAVRIGRATTTVGEIQALAPNDILLLDDTLLEDNLVCLIVDDVLASLGELDGKSLRLEGPLRHVDDVWLQRFTGGPSRRASNGSNGAESQHVVVIDMAYRTAKISELLRIEIDDAIPLPQGIDGVVEIRANKKRIGVGRLARAGSGIGVRITRIDPNAGI